MDNTINLDETYQQVLINVQKYLPRGGLKAASQQWAKTKGIKEGSAFQYLGKVKSGNTRNVEALSVLNKQLERVAKQL